MREEDPAEGTGCPGSLWHTGKEYRESSDPVHAPEQHTHSRGAWRSDTLAGSPERLQGTEDLLGLGDGEPTPQPELCLGLQRCVEGYRDLLGSGSL